MGVYKFEIIRLSLEPLPPEVADSAARIPAPEIRPGQVVENISHNVALTFRHNIVRCNRARGMLIASRGRTVIEDCDFHTSGAAILFEANGEYWFESGGTQDVPSATVCSTPAVTAAGGTLSLSVLRAKP